MGFVLVFLFSYLSYAGILVGNGGEGFLENKKIYVRDLYDAGIHQSPYFGEVAETRWLDWHKASNIKSIGVSETLLAKKLTDINKMEPHLGTWISQIINQYSWIFTEKELSLLLDDAPIKKDSEKNRVQIANRDLNTIRINSKAWKALSEEQKIALVIHEAIYSMVKPECKNPPTCTEFRQPSRIAREVVAIVFKKDEHLQPWMKLALGIPAMKENFPATLTDRASLVAVSKTYETEYGKQIAISFEPRNSPNNKTAGKGPTKESFEACKTKKPDDDCSFSIRDKFQLKGKCWSPQKSLPLACRPSPNEKKD